MARLTKKQVNHIALLAGFKLSAKEILKFQKDLSSTLDFVKTLEQIDTGGVKPTSQVTGLRNVVRKDQTCPFFSTGEALQNAPFSYNNFFQTKFSHQDESTNNS